MQENVGTVDRWARVVVGGALITGAVAAISRRKPVGAALMLAGGAVLLQTAVTRVCPLNALLGIDTRRYDNEGLVGRLRDGREPLRPTWREDVSQT